MNFTKPRKIAAKLIVYKNLRKDAILGRFFEAVTEQQLYEVLSLLVEASEKYGLSGDIFRQYVLRLLLIDENIFSLACERGEINLNLSLYKMALNDVKLVMELMEFAMEDVLEYQEILPYLSNFVCSEPYIEMCQNAATPRELLEIIMKSNKLNGSGVLFKNVMFTYAEGLVPAKKPAFACFDEIIGCERQKRILYDNVKAFINGKPAANMLLVGPKGTGKSSCVKALINEFGSDGLCVVAVSREQFVELPALLHELSRRGKKFIVLFDDLSFDLALENAEAGYKNLKSILEGGVEDTPKNVLFCATSNRRALVKEEWGDKRGTVAEDGEIHVSDAVNEKQSLRDRFGLVVSFAKPTPLEFYEIVNRLLIKEGFNISEDVIKRRANEWELGQSGLSGRAARNLAMIIMRNEYK